MKKRLITCMAILVALAGYAQSGSITLEMLNQIKKVIQPLPLIKLWLMQLLIRIFVLWQ